MGGPDIKAHKFFRYWFVGCFPRVVKNCILFLDTNQISTNPHKAPVNLKIQEKKAVNRMSYISPISQSTPETKLIEMSIIQYVEKSQLKILENTPKPVPKKLMSLDIKSTHQLEKILNSIEQKTNHMILNTDENSNSERNTINCTEGPISKERYIESILIEDNFTVSYDSDLITESQTSLNMSKFRALQNQTNERGFGALSNTDDNEMQTQEDDNIIIEYGLDNHCSNMTQNFW